MLSPMLCNSRSIHRLYKCAENSIIEARSILICAVVSWNPVHLQCIIKQNFTVQRNATLILLNFVKTNFTQTIKLKKLKIPTCTMLTQPRRKMHLIHSASYKFDFNNFVGKLIMPRHITLTKLHI